MCEQLLQGQKRKDFLHCIVTDDEKWIHYDNSKRKKSSHKHNIHGKDEYSWIQAYALYIVRSVGFRVLPLAPT